MKEIKTTSELRSMLLECIADVRSKKIDPGHATAVARLTGHILVSAKLDLQFMKFNGKQAGGKPKTGMQLR